MRRAEPGIAFAGRYARSFVPCGTGCGGYWLVDRRTGRILALPDDVRDGEMVVEVTMRRDSDMLRVIHGARDGVGACGARAYRLKGVRFVAVGGRTAVRCPE